MTAMVFKNINSLIENKHFQSKAELYEYIIMHIIDENKGPIGSWAMKAALNEYEAKLSTASIGRYLKELDSKGITEAVSNKGRILTEKGKNILMEIEESVTTAMLHNNVREATDITEYSQLIQLYFVREALETEAVREAIQCATDGDLNEMELTVQKYKMCIERKEDFTDPALNFHVVLAKSTKNRFLEAILVMLIHEQKRIEAKFEILATRDMEYGRQYAKEHEEICKALKERDVEKATRLMAAHLKGTRGALENDETR